MAAFWDCAPPDTNPTRQRGECRRILVRGGRLEVTHKCGYVRRPQFRVGHRGVAEPAVATVQDDVPPQGYPRHQPVEGVEDGRVELVVAEISLLARGGSGRSRSVGRVFNPRNVAGPGSYSGRRSRSYWTWRYRRPGRARRAGRSRGRSPRPAGRGLPSVV
jgi:hypothetical protein